MELPDSPVVGSVRGRSCDLSVRPGLNIRVDVPAEGRENMAIDRNLLGLMEQVAEPVTVVRFYRWKNLTVSVGHYQEAQSVVDGDYCRNQKIDVVRRPTGGRAVLHGDEVTYAVISNQVAELGRSISAAYLAISQVLCRGLRQAGVEAELNGRSPVNSIDPRQRLACFSSVSRHEITWRGRKIVGSAQRRLRRSFLQHGSIPLSIDYELMARCLGSSEPVLRRAMASISEVLSRPVSFEYLQPYLQQEFDKKWGYLV